MFWASSLQNRRLFLQIWVRFESVHLRTGGYFWKFELNLSLKLAAPVNTNWAQFWLNNRRPTPAGTVFNTVVSSKILELISVTIPDIRYNTWFQLQYLISVTIPDFSSINLLDNGTDISSITSSIPLFQLLCGLDLVMELIKWNGTSNWTEN